MKFKVLGVLSAAAVAFVGCAKAPFENQKQLSDVVPDSYIVVLKNESVKAEVSGPATRAAIKSAVARTMKALSQVHYLNEPDQMYSFVLRGGLFHMSADQAMKVAQDSRVAYVEPNRKVSINTAESNATWGLDRIDQQSLPLDSTYNYDLSGSVVNAYVIDTGILTTHQEFQGRATKGTDVVDPNGGGIDCNGHGTHVAGTIGSQTYGVAKNVKLYAVRVLDCNGSGTYANVISGIEWVASNHVKPAVANMSLGGPASQAVDDAVAAAIQAGVTFAVAGGNENASACDTSPSRVPTAITVGASTNTDARASFSNWGTCLSLYAPGQNITSTWIGSNTQTNTISGTSMATPHVVGAAALYLAKHPTALPAEVKSALTANAVSGKISDPGTGSPNLLLNIQFLLSGGGGGGGGGGSGDTDLTNNVPVSSLNAAKDEEKYFKIEVPASSSRLVVTISGGSGDADLYVKSGARATKTSYDCRPYLSGNNETCTIDSPAKGTYYVMLRGYSAFSGVTLSASVQAGGVDPNAPCTGCDHYSGQLMKQGDIVTEPTEGSYHSNGGTQEIWLKGPSGTDFDIYLYQKSGSNWIEVASSLSVTSNEKITYDGTNGDYKITVVSYSGVGKFDLWKK